MTPDGEARAIMFIDHLQKDHYHYHYYYYYYYTNYKHFIEKNIIHTPKRTLQVTKHKSNTT